jgi:COP9 signalosome complex subunit 2
LLKTIQPYTRIRLSFIAAELNIPLPDLEELLVALILDGHIDGHVDQVSVLLRPGGRG